MATKTIEIVLKIPARAVNSMKDSIRGSVEDAMMEELELEWDDFRDLISKDELNAFMAKHEARINKALVKDCASELKCFADEIDGSFWAGENTAFNFLTRLPPSTPGRWSGQTVTVLKRFRTKGS